MPDVSIIVPVYNARQYLEECIESLISQKDFSRSEVILVDDGSSDGSSEICDSYEQKRENITVIHKKNAGVSAARNDGAAAASSEYVTFCDADDRLKNDILSEILITAQKYSPDLIFWNYTYENNGSPFDTDFGFPQDQLLDRNFMRRAVPEYMLRDTSFNSVWNKAFKKSIIEENGILFNPKKKYGEDREFLLSYLSKCGSGYFIAQTGYFYRDTVSGAIKKERTDFFDNISEDYYTNLKSYRLLDFDEDELLQKCREALPEQIISDVFFIYENYDKKIFSESLKSLFGSELLMDSVSEYIGAGKFKNENYRITAEKIVLKKEGPIRRFLGTLKAKEAVYKLLKG